MEQRRSSIVIKRALFILTFFLLAVIFLLSRFVYIQAAKEVQGNDLQSLLEQRWTQSRILEGHRGTIYDKNGEALAEEVPSYTIVAILDERYENRVKDVDKTAVQLSTVLDMETSTIRDYLQSGIEQERVQVELGSKAKYLSYETRKKIEALDLEGIILREDPKRYYPKQVFASHILGYTERDMSNARMGIESSLNDYLSQENGKIIYKKDGANRKLWDANEVIEPPKNGNDVYLTLDTRIQMVIEQTMNQVDEEFSPERIMAIVANAKTGEILGMSNRPSFNPNIYQSIENYINYNVSSRFEPGSTMKMFSLAAAIEEGVYNGEETYMSGIFPVDGYEIRDHRRGGWGEITFEEGFLRSSNVAFSILAVEKLGEELLYHYLDAFGFTKVTGIDLPNEASSSIVRGSKSETATTAFGQGTTVTPIQQIQAATAIANGGEMMKPYIIDRIVNGDNSEVVLKNEPEVVGEPISEETARQVLDLLQSVVTSEVGTGKPFAIEGFNIAGKTGTAQIPSEDGGYLTGHGNSIFSFLGMAPAEDPEVIVYVAVDRPEIEEYEAGSLPVSMIFKTVMKQSLQYLNISPTEAAGVQDVDDGDVVIDVTGLTPADAKSTLEGSGYEVVVLGDSNKIETQYPPPGEDLIVGEKVFIKTDGDTFYMPDITNWSLRQVYVLQELMGVQVDATGQGFVYEQTPDPGTNISDLERMIVNLRLPGEKIEEEELLEVENETTDDELEEFFMN